jgi:hypothetical protein
MDDGAFLISKNVIKKLTGKSIELSSCYEVELKPAFNQYIERLVLPTLSKQ